MVAVLEHLAERGDPHPYSTAWQCLYREDASERILELLMELGTKSGHCQ